MLRDYMVELLDIGNIVDELDKSLLENKLINVDSVLMYASTIEEKLDSIDIEQLDSNRKIVCIL